MSVGPPEQDTAPVDILLVDDRPSNLSALQALLARPDYNLICARSGAEALAQVLRRDLAVILLDVAMPGMDGFEVASMIREREQSRHVPILFITASVFDMEHVFRGYADGAVDYLRKPINPGRVRSKVAVFVQLHRQRRKLELQAARLQEAEARERERARLAREVRLQAEGALEALSGEGQPPIDRGALLRRLSDIDIAAQRLEEVGP